MVPLHIYNDGGSTLKIVELDYTTGSYDETKLLYAVDAMISRGAKLMAIKVHSEDSDVLLDTDPHEYFTQYKAQIERLFDVFEDYDIPNFFILNESPDTVSNPAYVTYITDLLTTIKGAGFKAGITHAGAADVFDSLYNNQIDIAGLNVYSGAVGLNSFNTTYQQAFDAWPINLARIRSYRTLYPDVPVWITEFGCTDYPTSLENAIQTTAFPGQTTTNGQIQSIYYSAAFDALSLGIDFDYTFMWDRGSGFSPLLTGTESLKLMYKLFK